MLFFAPAAGLDAFLDAVDGLVALSFADFALVEEDAFFLAVMTENFRRI